MKAKLDEAAPIPVVLFLSALALLGWVSQPALFYIDPNEREAFFSTAGDLSQWFQDRGQPEDTYLLVSTNIDEREWFPYLLRRDPVMSGFGAEWVNGLARQIPLQEELAECVDRQSLACLEVFMETNHLAPDYLITHANDGPYSISASLAEGDTPWMLLYSNAGFAVWGTVSAP
jgi:hypothetical protein